LFDSLVARWAKNEWLVEACRLAETRLRQHPHGDLPRWRAALSSLPMVETSASPDRPTPELGVKARDHNTLRKHLMELHPWRKGPLRLAGLKIETEWRSDWKWDRIAPHIDLRAQRVLDIGSGNGYFGLRMLGAGAEFVVGIDPTILFVMQWLACRHFSGETPN
jgi:tRNA (mo5U34)-methyltransferase